MYRYADQVVKNKNKTSWLPGAGVTTGTKNSLVEYIKLYRN
jgi:hypothetical protein